jgi:hypothetical protein
MKIFGCAAGAMALAIAASAGAQSVDLPWGGDVRADPVGCPGGYEGRAVQPVYSHGSGAPLVAQANAPQVLEDVSFAPGFWQTGSRRVISQVTYGVGVMGTPTSNQQILLVFWDKDDVNFDGYSGPGTNMISPAAAPLAVVRVSPGALPPPFYYMFTTGLTGMPGGGVQVPDGDSGVALQVAWINGGCTPAQYQDLSACLYGGCSAGSNLSLLFGASGPGPGSTSADFGRDIADPSHCATFGRFVSGAGGEHAVLPGSAFMLGLYGDIAPVTCTADFDGDGDAGTDADIEAFFACLAGNCCATCGSPDFNADGDTGTDADIESFFRVLAGGAC